jgi:hypothetical protein
VDVLVDLHSHEGAPEDDRGQEPELEPLLVVLLDGGEGLHHGDRRADQDEGVDCGEGTFRTSPGAANWSGWANRRMMYAPIREVKNITSDRRNTHIPSFRL